MTYIPPELQDGPKNDPVPEDAGGDVPELSPEAQDAAAQDAASEASAPWPSHDG